MPRVSLQEVQASAWQARVPLPKGHFSALGRLTTSNRIPLERRPPLPQPPESRGHRGWGDESPLHGSHWALLRRTVAQGTGCCELWRTRHPALPVPGSLPALSLCGGSCISGRAAGAGQGATCSPSYRVPEAIT